jgi:hypothetical protein
VERWDEQLALGPVLLAGEREQRAGAEHPSEVLVEVVDHVGAGREELLDLVRPADHHCPSEDRHVDGERVAEAGVQPGDAAARHGQRVRGLHEARGGRTWWKRHRCGTFPWYATVPE